MALPLLGRNDSVGGVVRPHPGPLPRERERQPAAPATDTKRSTRSRAVDRSPSPWGEGRPVLRSSCATEGRGEGERSHPTESCRWEGAMVMASLDTEPLAQTSQPLLPPLDAAGIPAAHAPPSSHRFRFRTPIPILILIPILIPIPIPIRAHPVRNRWATGMRRPMPNARGDTFRPGAAWRRLYSLKVTLLTTSATTAASWPRSMISLGLMCSTM